METITLTCENCGHTTEAPAELAELLADVHYFCDTCIEVVAPLIPSEE
jgi:hypothetical protein